MKYIDVTRTTYTSLDVLLEKNIEDYWNVHGERELSETWTGFTRFFLRKERPPEGYPWSGERRENKQPLVVMMYGQVCGSSCSLQQKREQNKDGQSRNQNSKTPDNWEEYSSLSQTTKNSNSQWKPLVESWKFRCQQQCYAKYRFRAVEKPTAILETQDKTRLCCRCRRIHETKARRSWTQTSSRSHYCKRDEFFYSSQSCSQIHSDASSIKNSRCKGGSGEGMRKTGENSGMAADESQKQERGDRWSKK